MSKKPSKRGDQKVLEAKMARRKRLDGSIAPLPPRTMIFCEGTKTEPHYLREIARLINSRHREYAMGNRIELSDRVIISGTGRSTTSLLQHALANVSPGVSAVWLVYDHDDFPPQQFNETPKMAAALSKKKMTQYNVAWSNECFELWVLLHFIPLEANISREEYRKKIKVFYPEYHKSAEDVFSRLKDSVGTAIVNAKVLEGKYDRFDTPSNMAPCTLVYRLVEDLLRYT